MGRVSVSGMLTVLVGLLVVALGVSLVVAVGRASEQGREVERLASALAASQKAYERADGDRGDAELERDLARQDADASDRCLGVYVDAVLGWVDLDRRVVTVNEVLLLIESDECQEYLDILEGEQA